jgi:hypothetical protein
MEQRDSWCTQCKWKKACSRFADSWLRLVSMVQDKNNQWVNENKEYLSSSHSKSPLTTTNATQEMPTKTKVNHKMYKMIFVLKSLCLNTLFNLQDFFFLIQLKMTSSYDIYHHVIILGNYLYLVTHNLCFHLTVLLSISLIVQNNACFSLIVPSQLTVQMSAQLKWPVQPLQSNDLTSVKKNFNI